MEKARRIAEDRAMSEAKAKRQAEERANAEAEAKRKLQAELDSLRAKLKAGGIDLGDPDS